MEDNIAPGSARLGLTVGRAFFCGASPPAVIMPAMRYDQIVRSREGMDRHVQSLDEIRVPDIWHTVTVVKNIAEGETPERRFTKEDAEMLLET